MVVITCIYLIISLIISNLLTHFILRFHSSILVIHRNILTYLNTFLIISMDACVCIQVIILEGRRILITNSSNFQCLSVLLRILHGPFHLYIAIFFRATFFWFLFLLHGIVFAINVFRIIIVFKV